MRTFTRDTGGFSFSTFYKVMNECFDTECFIELVRERPAIWDIQEEDYSNKITKQQCWNEIFSAIVPDFTALPHEEKKRKSKEIQRRWKSLRNSFTRELAKQKQSKSGEGASTRKTYIYFELLSFLKPTLQNISTKSSLDPERESQEGEEDISQEFILPSYHVPKKKRKFDDTENHLKELNETMRESIRMHSIRDDDELFLLSLHAHLKTIPNNKKLLAKVELIQVLTKYNDQLQYSTDRPSPSFANPSATSTPVIHYPPYPQSPYYPANMPNHFSPRSIFPVSNKMVQSTPFPQSINFPVSSEESSVLSILISKPAPNWESTAVINGEFKELKLKDYKGKYLVFFFYPLDFTFVCPTEIIAFSDRVKEFHAINTEVVACSVDSPFTHLAWMNTQRKLGGLGPINIPLLSDLTHQISKDYGVYLEDLGHTLRGLFIVDDKGILRQITMNDLPVGRSVDETLRLVQAFQYTDKHGEVCPAGWKPGGDTIIPNPEDKLKYFSKFNQ